MVKLPKGLRGVLWSRKLSNLDLKEDESYIVHQVLAYGNFEQVKWLFRVFPKKEVFQVFLDSPRKNYSPASFNFVKNYLLGLEKQKIDPKDYVKTLF